LSKALSEKLLSRIIDHPNVNASEQAVRNAISTIRRKNPGVTLNAAAFIYAEKKGFKVWKQLDAEDRLSLQYRKDFPLAPSATRVSRPKKVLPSYGTEFHKDANANAGIYPYLYILENVLRKAILDEFKTTAGWWTNTTYVKKEIQDYASYIQNQERRFPWVQKRGGHPIFYVGLNELYRIITKNWSRFRPIFVDQGNLKTWFDELVPVRNLVAHNVKTSAEERANVKNRTGFICNTVENSTAS
jgi:hypothetical protein